MTLILILSRDVCFRVLGNGMATYGQYFSNPGPFAITQGDAWNVLWKTLFGGSLEIWYRQHKRKSEDGSVQPAGFPQQNALSILEFKDI